MISAETGGWPEELDAALATHLYRIVQAALNNIVAHARASEVIICRSADELTWDDGALERIVHRSMSLRTQSACMSR